MASTSNRQNWFIDFLIEDKYRFYRHLLIWVYLIFTEYRDADAQRQYAGNYDLYHYIGRITLFLLAVYLNMYVLVPRLLFRDRYFAYFMALILMTAGAYLLPTIIYGYLFETHQLSHSLKQLSFFSEVVPNMNVLGVAVFASTSIKLFQRWKMDATRMGDMEKSSLEVELRELKNQISPHFLFNMLNNVNVLIGRDPHKASAVVVKLSEFLRYQLYEAGGASVSLHSEVRFLNDFLELEKIRRDDFTFTICQKRSSEMIADLLLPPGLFLTFVENAVKHSADTEKPSSVVVSFECGHSELSFTCINTKPEEPAVTSQGGLGLTNIRRRLDLLYSEKCILAIKDLPETFEVTLSIPL
jgi:two-component system LytT family sensor kinase